MPRFQVLAVFLTLSLAVSIAKTVYKTNANEIRRGDEYIDKLLQDMIEERGNEYDPYYLEDRVIGFSRKVAFVNISGEAKLHSGRLVGLKTLHRSDHCSVTERDGRLHVKADLGAGVLKFDYSGTVKFMNWGPSIQINGELSYIEVLMYFSVDAITGKMGLLKGLSIEEMRGMKVKVKGLGPLNWALNPIIKAVTKIFKGYVKNLIENKVESHIAERIQNFQFPIEDKEETEGPIVTDSDSTITASETSDVTTESETEDTKATPEPEPETEATPEPEPETEATPEPEPETEAPTEPETEEPKIETDEPIFPQPEPEPEEPLIPDVQEF